MEYIIFGLVWYFSGVIAHILIVLYEEESDYTVGDGIQSFFIGTLGFIIVLMGIIFLFEDKVLIKRRK